MISNDYFRRCWFRKWPLQIDAAKKPALADAVRSIDM
jgi:hypothetical protein